MTNEEKVALACRLSDLRETSVKAINSQVDAILKEFVGGVIPFKVRCNCGWQGWDDDCVKVKKPGLPDKLLTCPKCSESVRPRRDKEEE